MSLHFEEPKDKTKETSAVFEFFSNTNNPDVKVHNRKKGKSLAKLIEDKKFNNYYHKKKKLRVQIELLKLIITGICAICIVMILFLILKLTSVI